jgi:YD repeat-containing protein
VRLWDGSVTYSERDPLPSDEFALFTRNYDTNNLRDGVFGTGWRSAFDAGLVHFTAGSIETVTIQMEGERAAAFIKSGGVWTQSWPSGIGAAASLIEQSDGTWLYRDGGSSLVRIFRSDGHFAGLDDRASSRKVLIDYSTAGLPQRVYSADGTWSCTITVTGNHITTISVDTRPDLTWQYSYSGSLLQSVTLSGSTGSWRAYEYTGGLLSAVRDAAGNLIESHTFDAHGRATDSIGAGGPDITNIEYDLPGSLPDSTITRVTYATGEQTTFDQRFIDGRQQTFAVTGGCGSCGSRNSMYAVDDSTGQLVREQDARGYIRSLAYDAAGRVIQELRHDRPADCDPEQDPSHCRMTAASLLTASLQSTAASTYVNYSYGDSIWPDKPTLVTTPSVANPAGTRTELTAYDPATGVPLTKTVTGFTDPKYIFGRTTTVSLYDGTMTAATAGFDPGRNFSASWLTLPQPVGKTRVIDGPQTSLNDITTFVYYPVDNSVPAAYRGRLAAVRNAAGYISTFENYDVFGNAGRVVDPNGVATETTYDALGRVLTTTLKGVSGCSTTADALCATDLTNSRTYSPATGPLTSQTDANGNVTTYEYDPRGRMTALSRGPSASLLKERMDYTYDPGSGKKSLERYLAMENGSWAEKRRESFSYDNLTQLTAQTHADNSSTAYTYDDAGDVTSVRDENHSTANTSYSYDPARRLTSVQQMLGNASVTTAYAYDIAGNLASVTDPNGSLTSYTYDDFGEMSSQTSPVTGATTYAYGTAGELLSVTDANGATTTRTYDALNRIRTAVSSRTAQSDETVAWSYDSGTFGLGRPAQMSDPAGVTNYTYDRRGMLLSESRTFPAPATYSTSYQYDANGNRTAIVSPSGSSFSYTYDYANRPLTLYAGAYLYATGARYLPFGPETSLTFGNSTIQTHTYDSRYRHLSERGGRHCAVFIRPCGSSDLALQRRHHVRVGSDVPPVRTGDVGFVRERHDADPRLRFALPNPGKHTQRRVGHDRGLHLHRGCGWQHRLDS